MSSTKAAFKRVVSAVLILAAVQCVADGRLKTGDPLPDLGPYELDGKLPADLKGKVVLLDFWASWCAPCKESFPVMEKLHQDFAATGLVVVAVNVDEKSENMEKFLKRTPATFAVVRDSKQKLVKATDVTTMPTSFLVDRTGKVRFVHSGFIGKTTARKYREEVELLLKEKAP